MVLFPRRRNQTHNSTAHAERAIGAVKGHYQTLSGRTPGKDHLVDYGNTMKRGLKGLTKIHTKNTQKRLPLLPSHMRAVRDVMKLREQEDITFWALWLAQWQGLMRGSDILRPVDQKGRKWDTSRDTHIGRLLWENVDPKPHHGCEMRLQWTMKQSKTDQSVEKAFERSFLVDHDHDILSAEAAIEYMLTNRGHYEKDDPLFIYPNTRKEVTIAASKRKLAKRVEEAGFSGKFIEGHSLRIGGSSAYANYGAAGPATAGFMGFWTLGSRCDYM